MSLDAWRDWFVAGLFEDPKEERRAGLLVSSSFVIALWGPLFTALMWWVKMPKVGVVVAIATVSLSAAPFVLRFSRSLLWASNYTVALIVVTLVALIEFSGGYSSPYTLMAGVPALVAWLLLRGGWRIFWIATVFVVLWGLYAISLWFPHGQSVAALSFLYPFTHFAEYLTKPIERERLLSILGSFRPRRAQGPVLIVEDDDNTRELLVRMLSRNGWETLEAAHGQAALEVLDVHTPSLIISDLMMPVMDGFSLIEELSAHEAWAEIPVVVLTAMELSEEDLARLNERIRSVLRKAHTSLADVEAQVKALLARYVPAREEEVE